MLIAAPEGGYVAFNPETETTTQDETVEEATGLYLEEVPVTINPFFPEHV